MLTLLPHCCPSPPATTAARPLVLLSALAAAGGAFAADAGRTYDISYLLTPEPGGGTVKVELDLELLYTMVASGRDLSLDQLRDEAKRLIGKNPDALRDKRLPGCAMLHD